MARTLLGLTIRTGRALLVGVTALALVSCASGTDESGSSSAPKTPATKTPIPRAAADGTDLNACKDGVCEVKVAGPAKIPVGHKFQIDDLKVKSIGSEEVFFSATGPKGRITRICGTFCFEGTGGTHFETSANAGSRVTANKIAIMVLSIADGSAILRLTPA